MSILDWNDDGKDVEDYLVGWSLEFDGNQSNAMVFININQYEYQSKIIDETVMNCNTGNGNKMIIKSISSVKLSII